MLALIQSQTAAWSLYGDGHVLAAAIVHERASIEARVLLDGHPLYRSRHTTWASAAEELVALRSQWASDGWLELA
jgi:hypothetical protein